MNLEDLIRVTELAEKDENLTLFIPENLQKLNNKYKNSIEYKSNIDIKI